MENNAQSLKRQLQALDVPLNRANLERFADDMRDAEVRLRQALSTSPRDSELLGWVNAWSPALYSCGFEVFQNAISLATANFGKVSFDGCVGFCPVTLVITPRTKNMQKITTDILSLKDVRFVEAALERNRLAEDFEVHSDVQLYPINEIARLGLAEISGVARRMTDAVTMSRAISGEQRPVMTVPEDAMASAVSIAGSKIIGSFLLPVVYVGQQMDYPPETLLANVEKVQLQAFSDEMSQELTAVLDRRSDIQIEAIVGYPRLILTALYESVTAHCATSAYWAASAAIDKGINRCAVTYGHSDTSNGVEIAFTADPEIDGGFYALANTQSQIDQLTKAFAQGARDAGMTNIDYIVLSTLDDTHRTNDESNRRTYN